MTVEQAGSTSESATANAEAKAEAVKASVQPRPGFWIRLWQRIATFWECDPAKHNERSRFGRVVCYVRRLTDAFATHQCSLMACACAFCALLSLIPLLILGIAGLGFFLGGQKQAMDQVITAVYNYIPVRYSSLHDILDHVMQQRRMLSVFGLGGLMYGAHQTFLSMMPAMNIIWGVTETRHWLFQRALAIGTTLYAIVLMGGNIALSGVVAYLQQWEAPGVLNTLSDHSLKGALTLAPVLFTTLLFALIYRILPCRNVPWKAALLGAFVAAVAWEITKVGFGISLRYVTSYDRLYGPLASLVIIVVWTFYSMTILLAGAEICADYVFMQRGEAAAESRAHSGADLSAATGKEPLVPFDARNTPEINAGG